MELQHGPGPLDSWRLRIEVFQVCFDQLNSSQSMRRFSKFCCLWYDVSLRLSKMGPCRKLGTYSKSLADVHFHGDSPTGPMPPPFPGLLRGATVRINIALTCESRTVRETARRCLKVLGKVLCCEIANIPFLLLNRARFCNHFRKVLSDNTRSQFR